MQKNISETDELKKLQIPKQTNIKTGKYQNRKTPIPRQKNYKKRQIPKQTKTNTDI